MNKAVCGRCRWEGPTIWALVYHWYEAHGGVPSARNY